MDGEASRTYRPLENIERVHVLVRETFDERATGVVILNQKDSSRTASMSSVTSKSNTWRMTVTHSPRSSNSVVWCRPTTAG